MFISRWRLTACAARGSAREAPKPGEGVRSLIPQSSRITTWPIFLLALALGSCAPEGLSAAAPDAPASLPVQPILLHAKHATVHGTGAHYEAGPERDNIGFWTNINEWVGWEFTLDRPGTFLVQVTLACPPDTAGSDYEVILGPPPPAGDAGSLPKPEQRFVGTVKSTGGWGTFVTEPLGIASFDRPGTYAVAVKPLTKPKGAVMNLQAITLRPGQWERGLAAWWRFDEGEGAEAEDGASGTRDTAAFARWSRGVAGSALRLNGYSSYVARKATLAPQLRDALTVEAWVYLLGEPDGWCAIVNQHHYPLGYYFGLDGAGELGFHVGVRGRWHSCTARVKLPVRQWTHVAATYDKMGGIVLYANGQEVAHQSVVGEIDLAADTDLLIGKHNAHPWVFHVLIDEVKLYRRALSAADIARHHAAAAAAIEPLPVVAIRGVRPDRPVARVGERVTLDVDLAATYDNPFDSDDVRIEAVVATPSRRILRVPGFLYQPFDRLAIDAAEVVEAQGPPRWQVRLSFAEPGAHFVRVGAWDRTGAATSESVRIDVAPSDSPGMVRRHLTDHRYFVTERGESFFPIGANVCWADAGGTFSYDEWLGRYAANGCNFFRVWLSPFWTTLAMNTTRSGGDAIDLANAWRLDHVLETAERLGLRAMLCIDSFNILRTKEKSPGNYELAPYVRALGGPLGKPLDYFTSPWSRKLYRDRLRYLVARYGYSPSVFAWEFWNEVDIIDDYDSKTVVAWHRDMAQHLRALDPWRHLITTSFASPQADPTLMALPELDFAQPHFYGAKDIAKEHAERLPVVAMPVFFGEFGIEGDGRKTAETDPTGINLHNAFYASVGQGQAGTPMTWWWDSYVHPKDLYPVFGAFARWVAGFDFVAERARKAELKLVCEDLVLKEPTTLTTGKGSWEPSDANKPLTVRVDRDGVLTHDVAVSELLHGLGFHKDKHNPVTFELDVPEPGAKFGVEVKGLSGFGDGNLQISLDGKLALDKPMPLPEKPKDVVHTYNGVYEIGLPAGKHTVKVENTGKDWISVASYKIPWLKAARAVSEPLRASGLVGQGKALLWVQNKLHTWVNATAKDFKAVPVKGAKLIVGGLAAGRWTIEHWDTVVGAPLVGVPPVGAPLVGVPVGQDGKLTIALPEIAWDAALRLRREP